MKMWKVCYCRYQSEYERQVVGGNMDSCSDHKIAALAIKEPRRQRGCRIIYWRPHIQICWRVQHSAAVSKQSTNVALQRTLKARLVLSRFGMPERTVLRSHANLLRIVQNVSCNLSQYARVHCKVLGHLAIQEALRRPILCKVTRFESIVQHIVQPTDNNKIQQNSYPVPKQ